MPSAVEEAMETEAPAASENRPAKDSPNLPWVEKYRPSRLEDLVSQQDIIHTLQKLATENRLPHLLFYGPPGTGKTTTILAIARQMYSPKLLSTMVLELNASDDRGIGVVREEIVTFASSRALLAGPTKGLKLVILDECDAMTKDAQNALRRVMEKYTSSVRFCLIGNYLSKIIPALQSRCTRFRFPPLQPALMIPRLKHVAREEGVSLTEDGERALVGLSAGDMRRVLNVLQSTHMALGEVNEANVYQCVGAPQKADVRTILDALLNLRAEEAYQKVESVRVGKGLALADVVAEVALLVERLEVPEAAQAWLVSELGRLEVRLAQGASEKVQLAALVAAFSLARQTIAAQPQDDDDQLIADLDL